MLTLIFGVWMNLAKIDYLSPKDNECMVYFTERPVIIEKTCNKVAAEMQKRAQKLGVNPIDCATREERLQMIASFGAEKDLKSAIDWWLTGSSRISNISFYKAFRGAL